MKGTAVGDVEVLYMVFIWRTYVGDLMQSEKAYD